MSSKKTETVAFLQQLSNRYKRYEIAEMLSVDPRTITRWRIGESSPPPYVTSALKDILNRTKPESINSDFTFIDLFAGIGGIRFGFEQQGGKCVFTSEWNEFSQKTYRENFGEEHLIVGDIVPYDAKSIPNHDVLLAGFPCQPFSIAGVSKKNSLGRPHGFECTTQGTLFFDVARIIATKRPKAFLLENVKNLRSHDKGNTFRVLLDVLERELKYKVSWRVIDGQRFVPQHRERLIITGFCEDTGFDLNTLVLPDLESGPKIESILHPEDGSEVDIDNGRFIDDKGCVQSKYTLTPRLWQYLRKYAEKHRLKGNGFGFGLIEHGDTSRTLSARYYKDGSEILISRGKRCRPRRLTPRECARLMGFPANFKIPVSDTQAYQQFGNSVVVPVIAAVAKHMKPHILELTDCKLVKK